MMNTASLSLEQAPPISIPFRFFFTAPVFGMAAAAMVLVDGGDLFLTRWAPSTLALTHLITLGFLAMVMCGAMMQMLPVLAGSPVPRVVPVGWLTHVLIALGAAFLVAAFYLGHSRLLFTALCLLGAGFTIFLAAVAIALWRVKLPSATITGMRLAVLSLLVTVLLGVTLASGLMGFVGFNDLSILVDLHLGWGVLGWVGLLLLGVSFQVVPMFQVTPEYPDWMRSYMARGLFISLLAWSLVVVARILGFVPGALADLLLFVAGAGFSAFAFTTLDLQQQRKRRVPDVTLMFWRLGVLCVLLAFLFWVAAHLFPALGRDHHYGLLLGVLLLFGAGISLVNGMLYKIVPFLSWFHLQNRQMRLMCWSVKVPNMKELVPDRLAKRQFYLHLGSLVLTLAATFQPHWLARPGALLFLLSNALLLANMARALRIYRITNKKLIPENPA
jgi:hypothetical protein